MDICSQCFTPWLAASFQCSLQDHIRLHWLSLLQFCWQDSNFVQSSQKRSVKIIDCSNIYTLIMYFGKLFMHALSCEICYFIVRHLLYVFPWFMNICSSIKLLVNFYILSQMWWRQWLKVLWSLETDIRMTWHHITRYNTFWIDFTWAVSVLECLSINTVSYSVAVQIFCCVQAKFSSAEKIASFAT